MLHAILAAVIATTAPLFTSTATTPQSLPAMFPGRVLVGADINGHRLWFHLDTGADGLFIDREAAQDAGLAVAPDGSVTTDVTIGNLHATGARFNTISAYGFLNGVHVVGLIGTPFFESGIITIDFGKKQVLFCPPGTFDPASAGVAPIPIDFDGHVTRVHAWFGTTRATMLLDTGAQISMLFEPLAERLILGASLTQPSPITVGYGAKPTTEEQYHVKPLTFGGLRVSDPVLDVVDQAPPTLPTERYDGILGRDVLGLFRITLDYNHEVAYFNPET